MLTFAVSRKVVPRDFLPKLQDGNHLAPDIHFALISLAFPLFNAMTYEFPYRFRIVQALAKTPFSEHSLILCLATKIVS